MWVIAMEFKVPTYKFTHTFTCTLALISCIALFIGVRAVVAANKKKCRQICLHQVKWIYIAHNLLCISCKMLKMAVWQPAIFMPFYEEKYGRYAAFCLIYAFVRSVHVIILRHPACISFTNHPCSFCLHSMFLPLTSDVLACPRMWFKCFT